MHSWKGRYEHFARPYFASYTKTKMSRVADLKALSEELSSKSCPLGHEYDPDLHYAVAHFRILDGSLPEHPSLGRSVNLFAPVGEEKFWVKSDTPVFGYFFYYTLDMAVCPYLASIFGMPIWHPRNETQVDELLKAGVEVYVTPLLVLAMTCLRAMMQSFPGARTRCTKNSRLFISSTRRCCILLMTFSGTWASKAQNTLKRWRAKLLVLILRDYCNDYDYFGYYRFESTEKSLKAHG